MDHETEKKWQERWQKSRIFEPDIDHSREKYFITVPWPYTNGALHVGHGRTYTIADIIARYKRIRNYNVLFPMAFHQSGTPILAFSERLRNNDPDTVQQYRDYLSGYEEETEIDRRIEEFKDPRKIAEYFSERIVKDFTELGYSIDWRRRFTSADPFYQEFVKIQFLKLKELGLIKQGDYPILYSIEDQNAVGEDDIQDGDINKVTIEEFTGVFFTGEKYSLVAASLRPETIFGITNLWISPDSRYVLLKFNDKKIVVSSESYEKLRLQNSKVEYISDVPVPEIVSHQYKLPFQHRKVGVYTSAFVDPDNGTGVVYSVPGHAVWDYVAMKEQKIDIDPIKVIETKPKTSVESLVTSGKISSISERDKISEATQVLYKEEFYNGAMNDRNEKYSGLSVQEAREKIKSDLFSEDLGFIVYECSRKAKTRGGSKVIVAVMHNQWFIDYSVRWWKDKSLNVVDEMQFYPQYYKDAMKAAIEWLRERPCARRRGLGTKLPFDPEWVIESLSDSTIYPAVYTNSFLVKEVFERNGKRIDEGTLDFIYFNGKPERAENTDKHNSELVKEARGQMDYWYGVDLRVTAYPHLSNHLSFYVMNHAALFGIDKQPKALVISGLVTSGGSKISKSKGNVITLLKTINEYSADIYRLFVAMNADISSTSDWNESEISTLTKKYNAFVDLFTDTREYEKNQYIEDWFVSKFYMNVHEYFKKMEQFSIRDAYISIFYEVLSDLKHVEARYGNVSECLNRVKKIWLTLLTPVIPHTCEELWEKSGYDGFASTSKLDPKEVPAPDQDIIASEEYVMDLIDDVKQIIKATGLDPKMITIRTCDAEVRKMAETIDEGNKDHIDPRMKRFIPEFMKNRKNMKFNIRNEMEVIANNLEYLKHTFNCDIDLGESDPFEDKHIGWPGRPYIHILQNP
ncbi:MAG: leucine--tRNA ligase [Thermoplasmatales archaeon]|nr:leucine--tRNA ligase [Thermoplasmatales archaeon]MCW6170482.1 leucine--tRNA ligase [Thermoplasmatales archaeon]